MKKFKLLCFILILLLSISSPLEICAFNNSNQPPSPKEENISTESDEYDYIYNCPSESVNVSSNSDLENSFIFENSQHETSSKELSIPLNALFKVEDSSETIISAIKSNLDFLINGIITIGDQIYNINEYYDFSKASKYQIAEWAYSIGLITKENKIDCFCDLIIHKNFANVYCLENIFSEIQQYYETSVISSELEDKISNTLSVPFSNSNDTKNIINNRTYSSTNFKIHYNSDDISTTAAQSVAEYLEQIRNTFIDFGFRVPILQTLRTRYQVYLDSDFNSSNSTISGTATKVNIIDENNTCASYITIYNFTSLDDMTKEVLAHEYFHAIQNAYNHQSGWFAEACANWASIMITGDFKVAPLELRTFIRYAHNTPMSESSGYGAVMFPLTIHRNYGGAAAIVSIYEAYSNYPVYNTDNRSTIESIIREAVSLGIRNTGTNKDFVSVYREMSSYFNSTSTWYSEIMDYTWVNANKSNISTSQTSNSTLETTYSSFANSLDYLTSRCHTLTFPQNFYGTVKIDITFHSDNGYMQIYTESTSNSHIISYPFTLPNNTASFIQTNIGNNISSLTVIVSNASASGSMGYNIKVTLMPQESSIEFPSNARYLDRINHIYSDEYIDYNIRFNFDNYRMIQTFGDDDTIMTLYDENGNILATNDDGGYELNSAINYLFLANTIYKVRIHFYDENSRGLIKFAIIPINGELKPNSLFINTYQDILNMSSTTNWNLDSVLELGYVKAIIYTPPSDGYYRLMISSSMDTYMYIINPTSCDMLIEEVNYSDDVDEDNLNPTLTVELYENIDYLIIFCTYNPNSTIGNIVISLDKLN